MSRVAIVGGHGQIALLLTRILVERGDEVTSVIRQPEHEAELRAFGAHPAVVDLESVDVVGLAEVFSGADAIVFAAGAGPGSSLERKRTVDYGASVLSAAAAERAGVRRFIQISAIGVDQPADAARGDIWVAYVEAKRDADTALRATGLDWTILRPGTLTDETQTGLVEIADETARGPIPRADVAAIIAELLNSPGSIARSWDAISGQTPIADAVAGAAG